MTHKDAVKRLHNLFCKLHKYQVHGADNLILLITRYLHCKANYMASFIELVAERTGVSSTGHITTTNRDIMPYVVMAIVEIEDGIAPLQKDVDEAWALFIDDYRHNRIKL